MKKLLFLTVFLVPLLMADMITVKNGLSYYSYNQTISGHKEMTIKISYDTGDSAFVFIFGNNDFMTDQVWVQIDESQIAELDSVIKKYKEWNVKASKKGVEINKKITSINTEYIFFTYGDNLKNSANKELICEFRSLTEKKHLLKIYSFMVDIENEYIDPTFIALFNWGHVLALERAIAPAKLKEYRKKAFDTVDLESEFE